jgi:cytoskeletal protein RodZ
LNGKHKKSKKEKKSGGGWVAGVSRHGGVAVAGWEWYQSIRQVSAVRMVCVTMWQWQYWQRCSGVKITQKNNKNQKSVSDYKTRDSSTRSGSGTVTLAPIDRSDQRGSNGMRHTVSVAVSTEIAAVANSHCHAPKVQHMHAAAESHREIARFNLRVNSIKKFKIINYRVNSNLK